MPIQDAWSSEHELVKGTEETRSRGRWLIRDCERGEYVKVDVVEGEGGEVEGREGEGREGEGREGEEGEEEVPFESGESVFESAEEILGLGEGGDSVMSDEEGGGKGEGRVFESKTGKETGRLEGSEERNNKQDGTCSSNKTHLYISIMFVVIVTNNVCPCNTVSR